MIQINEAELREAIRLLDEIDGDPLHPANDKRHPNHVVSVKSYWELRAWCDDQQELLAKERLKSPYLYLDY